MASVTQPPVLDDIYYPTSDGELMGETPFHRRIMADIIDVLEDFYAQDSMVYVSGNMIMYYVEGDPTKQVVPDVFVAKGVSKDPKREIYQLWREGKAPDAAIEVSSKTTVQQDQNLKWHLYQNVLKIQEYFLFDPREDYLDPPLQGYRLVNGIYRPIAPVECRLPSEVLGLHLEVHGQELRFYDPRTGQWLLTPREKATQAQEALRHAEEQKRHAEEQKRQADAARLQAEDRQRQAETEIERLRKALEQLRKDDPRAQT
jgi:Uma2 family endonuclease